MAQEYSKRRRFSGAQKLEMIAMHLKQKKPVPEVCENFSIAPSQYYTWQEELFEKGEVVFESKGEDNKTIAKLKETIEDLKKQLSYKNTVLFELMEEHVKTKKKLGLS